jgi:phage-related minor tail protein
MVIKLLIIQPLMRGLQGLLPGSSLLPGMPGSPQFGPVAPSAHGNVFSGGNIVAFAQGGVVDSPTVAPMALFGESGPEAIVPLKRGSDGNLGISGGGGAPSTMHVNINMAGANGDDTIRKISFAATQQGMAAALKQVPNMAVRAVNDHLARTG